MWITVLFFVSEAVLSLGLSFFTLRPELKLSPKTNAQRRQRERERGPCFIVPWSFPRQRFDFTVILPTGVVFVCRNIIAVFSEVLSYLLLTLGAAHSTVAELTASTAQHRR